MGVEQGARVGRVDRAAPQVPADASAPADERAPTRTDLRVQQVTSHGWRLVDARLPLQDPFRVLAFVERRGDVFEVMQLGAGFEWHALESMDAAIEFVLESAPRFARKRLDRRLEWIEGRTPDPMDSERI